MKLTLKNFQGHEFLKIKLDPYVTTIIGPSDVGKSSIIRALRWLALNKPRGDAFIHTGADQAVVALRIDDHKITRSRGSENSYALDNKEFVSFGNTVPSEIQKVVNLAEINFQSQLDGHFWFSESAGEVSRQLNQIVNLELIDTTLSNIAGYLRKAKTNVDHLQAVVKTEKAARKRLKPVKAMDKELIAVESLKTKLDELTKRKNGINQLLVHRKELQALCHRYHQRAQAGRAILEKKKVWETLRHERASLRDLRRACLTLQALVLPPLLDTSMAARRASKWTTTRREVQPLLKLLQSAKSWQEVQEQATKALYKATIQFKKKMGNSCVLCEQPIQS